MANAKRPGLTPEEDALQQERSEHFKKLLHDICGDFAREAQKRDENVGLMLSGGVDSTVILWTLLNLGIKPYIYTFRLPNKPSPSADEAKAEAMAKHYGLPYRLVRITDDPNEMANKILDAERICSEGGFNMFSRADFEVLPIMRDMMHQAITQDDVRLMFSGIGEGRLYFLGRKLEIRGRSDQYTTSAMNIENLYFMDVQQNRALTLLAEAEGVSLCLANAIAANTIPYLDVPWKVINTPRKKEITLRAYKTEEKLGPVAPAVMPMQCGSSGAREYFDDMIPRSTVAQAVVGRPLTSAVVMYNAMKKNRTKGNSKGGFIDRPGDWMDYINGDLETLPEDSEGFYDHDTKRVIPPSNDGLFGDLFDDSSEDGEGFSGTDAVEDRKDDPRVDCMGTPFWMEQADTSCSYAAAGWASKPLEEGDPVHHITECSIWIPYGEDNRDYIKSLGSSTASHYREVYDSWAEKVMQSYVERKVEKIFPKSPHI